MGKLALTKPLITENLVSDKLVSKSIAILNDQEGTWSPFQMASFYTLFLNSLPFLNVVLNKSQLENVCSSMKSVFVDEKFSAIDGNFLEYNRRVKILFEFADTFVLWNINPDKISENIWNSWFDTAKRLLMAGLELNYPPLHRSQSADTSEVSTNFFLQMALIVITPGPHPLDLPSLDMPNADTSEQTESSSLLNVTFSKGCPNYGLLISSLIVALATCPLLHLSLFRRIKITFQRKFYVRIRFICVQL